MKKEITAQTRSGGTVIITSEFTPGDKSGISLIATFGDTCRPLDNIVALKVDTLAGVFDFMIQIFAALATAGDRRSSSGGSSIAETLAA